jgi:hypothetical protein
MRDKHIPAWALRSLPAASCTWGSPSMRALPADWLLQGRGRCRVAALHAVQLPPAAASPMIGCTRGAKGRDSRHRSARWDLQEPTAA